MRLTTFKMIFLTLVSSTAALGMDLGKYEEQCADIGFKKKTQAFGECVLELKSRGESAAVNNQGNGAVDHATCIRYGFRTSTSEYAQCRMQIDLARSQAQEQQAQYERQFAEQQRAKERARGEAALLLGLGMMAGQPRAPVMNGFNNFTPPPINRIYNLPGGKFMTCNTVGMVTNCQ
jgi:hypothetical protein